MRSESRIDNARRGFPWRKSFQPTPLPPDWPTNHDRGLRRSRHCRTEAISPSRTHHRQIQILVVHRSCGHLRPSINGMIFLNVSCPSFHTLCACTRNCVWVLLLHPLPSDDRTQRHSCASARNLSSERSCGSRTSSIPGHVILASVTRPNPTLRCRD